MMSTRRDDRHIGVSSFMGFAYTSWMVDGSITEGSGSAIGLPSSSSLPKDADRSATLQEMRHLKLPPRTTHCDFGSRSGLSSGLRRPAMAENVCASPSG